MGAMSQPDVLLPHHVMHGEGLDSEVDGLNKVLIVNVIFTYKCSSTRKIFLLGR